MSARNVRQLRVNSVERRAISFSLFTISFSLLFSIPAEAAAQKHPRRANTVLYQVKQDATSAQLAALNKVLRAHGFRSLRKMLNGTFHQAEASSPQGKTEEELAAEIKATGAVKFAELDGIESPALIPNDPDYQYQWHLPKINAPTAWNITTGNSAVIVAVCDTGVDSTHPDLAPNLLLPGYNSVDGSTNTSPAVFHGTYVAGALGAVGNNGLGVAGVSWATKILPIRVTNDTMNGSSFCTWIVGGIEYAVDHGTKVINLSYGTTGCPYSIDAAGQYAREKGGLLFVAAGNDATDLSLSYPALTSFVLVGAADQNDALASFSNYGTPIDLVAPGVNIETTAPGGGDVMVGGTSLATPIAAGVAALVYSLRPTFTPAQVENFLFSTAVNLGAPTFFGHGRVDAGAAVTAAQNAIAGTNAAPTVATAAGASPNPVTGTTANLSVFGADDGGEANLTYTWAPAGIPISPIGFSPNGTNAAKNTAATFTKAGSYPLQVTITDSKGLAVTSNVTVTVNQTFSAIIVNPPGANVQVGTPQTFAATTLDQFGHPMASQPSFLWSVTGGGSISSGGVFTAGGTAGGPYIVTASNGGVSGTAYVTVTASGSGPTSPGYLIKAASNEDAYAYGKLARTSDGKLHAVYYRVDNYPTSGWDSIFYAYSTDGGKTWTEELVDGIGATVGQWTPSFSTDASGNIHVAWLSIDSVAQNYSILYRQRASSTNSWLPIETISSFPAPQQPPTLVVDSAGRVDVIWSGPSSGQFRQRTPGPTGVWQTPETVPDPCGVYTSTMTGGVALAVDTADNLHTFDGIHHCLRSAISNTWQPAENVNSLSTKGTAGTLESWFEPAMAIDPGNNVHVAWVFPSWDLVTSTSLIAGFTNIVYSKRSAATNTWGSPEIVARAMADANRGNQPSIALDSFNNVHVVWLGADGVQSTHSNVQYRMRTSAGWQAPVQITNLPSDQGTPSLVSALDPIVSGVRPNIPQTGFALIYTTSELPPIQYKFMYYPSPNLTWPSGSGGSPPVINSPSVASGTVNTAFSYQITATNSSPTSFNATGLPAGLSVNTGTGQISGTPTTAGTSNVTLTAANASGPGTATLTLTIYWVCDVNKDNATNVLDVQLEVNQALGVTPCTSDINKDGLCNIIDVQRVTNAALGGACVSP